MALAVVHDNHLSFAGVDYFRGNAPSVSIGDYGEKKTPLFGQNYLAVQDNIPSSKLIVKAVTEVEIDTTKSLAADIKLNLKVAGPFSGGAEAAYEGLKSKTLKLMKFDMYLGDVKEAVNKSPGVLDNLASYGSDARVAHQIFVVMTAKEASAFKAGGTVTFSMQSGKLKAKGGIGGSTEIELSADTTYAYLLCKPDWNKGKTSADKFTDDQWSI